MDTRIERIRKAVGDAAQSAAERIGEMREVARINQQIRTLRREKERCRQTLADLVIRMLDQNTYVDALLRPEYNRIKEIDTEIVRLEEERAIVGQEEAPEQAPEAAGTAEAVPEQAPEAAEVPGREIVEAPEALEPPKETPEPQGDETYETPEG